jgi:hypothetical protein
VNFGGFLVILICQAGDVIQNVACERGRDGEVIGYVWEYEIDRQLTQTTEAQL